MRRNSRISFVRPCFGTAEEDAAKAAADAAGKVDFSEVQQVKVNGIVAEERRKFAQQLEAVRNDATTSQAQKAALEKQINELKTSYQTRAEQDAEKYGKELTSVKTLAEQNATAAKAWQDRYSTKVKQSELLTAAVANKAFNPALVVAILEPRTEIVELKDDKDAPTGKFEPRVRMSKIKDGKPLEMFLTPAEALQHMVSSPEEYGSLFESTAKGGMGNNNSSGKTGGSLAESAESDDFATFEAKYRAQHGLGKK